MSLIRVNVTPNVRQLRQFALACSCLMILGLGIGVGRTPFDGW